MTQADWKPKVQGIIDILPQEIDEFESEANRFQAGEFDPIAFQSFELIKLSLIETASFIPPLNLNVLHLLLWNDQPI